MDDTQKQLNLPAWFMRVMTFAVTAAAPWAIWVSVTLLMIQSDIKYAAKTLDRVDFLNDRVIEYEYRIQNLEHDPILYGPNSSGQE